MRLFLLSIFIINIYFPNVINCQDSFPKIGYCLTNMFNYYSKEDKGLDSMLNRQLKNNNLVRFPGGNISNYYHLAGSGYGLKENEFPNSNYFLYSLKRCLLIF